MSTSYFQGGDFVELLSAQGKAPAAHWKLQGKVSKSFDKLLKGNAFVLDGSADTRMQLPKDGASLGLTQRFLVLQLLIPLAKSFSLEIGYADFQRVRRRFVISSAFRETTVTALHAQIPLAAAAVPRDAWMNLVLDLQALTDTFFGGSVCRSTESLAIGGSCRLKRVFTMKDPPVPRGCVAGGTSGTADIPRQFALSCGKDSAPVPTEYFAVPFHSGGEAAGGSKPALDNGRGKRAGSAGSGPVKGRSAARGDAKKKAGGAESGASAPTTTSRTTTPVVRGERSRVPPRGVLSVVGVSEGVKAVERDGSAPSVAANAPPQEERKLQEARLSTPTRSVRDQEAADAEGEEEGGDWSGDKVKARREAAVSRPASAASERSSLSTRPSTSQVRRHPAAASIAMVSPFFSLEDEQGVEEEEEGGDARLASRPTRKDRDEGSKGGNRREIMSEIQLKLDLLDQEDTRVRERNRELFLRHTTLNSDPDGELDASELQPVEAARNERESEDSSSDHELELLLAAKRAARRGQPQATEKRQSERHGGHTQMETAELPDPSRRGEHDRERKSASIWRFSDRVEGGDGLCRELGEAEQEDVGTGHHRQKGERGEAEADDLSIDLTGELEDEDPEGGSRVRVDAGEDGAFDPHEAPDTTLSPPRRPIAGNEAVGATSASRISDRGDLSALSSSFDFGDLVESEGEERSGPSTSLTTAQTDRRQPSAELLEMANAVSMSSPGVSFDFGELPGGSTAPDATASPVVAGESSTAKRLQRLLESTEWRSLPALGSKVENGSSSSSTSVRRSGAWELGAGGPAVASQPSNSIELVYDPVLRCYYDPVADKYYALAK